MEPRSAHLVTASGGNGQRYRPMPEEDLTAKIAAYRETAETLRGIAEQLRFEPRRGNQIRALADGFERFALQLETASTMGLVAN